MDLILSLALIVTAADATTSPREGGTPRPLYEISRHIRTLSQRNALASSDHERVAAAVEMTEVYREILGDPRYATSPALKEYRARLWSRLTRIKKEIETRLRRDQAGRREPGGSDDHVDEAVAVTTRSLSDQFALIAAGQGGPAGVFHQTGAAGGAAVADYGPDLVALIQRTIQPEFWDVHGGPGTIVYYRPLHCLVVRATAELHFRLGSGLGDLRAAGK